MVEHAGAPVIVTEYGRGRSLGAVLKADGPLPVARAAATGGRSSRRCAAPTTPASCTAT
ncbi:MULTISPECIES: hypothetical protein [Streptomyces]|uniref:hypothetical protein n=1 Tax=Streptomyces TaxID=1883 RepID=UPI001E392C7E|nr:MULTISPECIES: hypothetical protein [Streptomyces]